MLNFNQQKTKEKNMKPKIILDIFNFQAETKTITESKEYYKVLNTLLEKTDELEKQLTHEQTNALTEISNISADLSAVSEDLAYVAGFKTGMRLVFEALSEDKCGDEDSYL